MHFFRIPKAFFAHILNQESYFLSKLLVLISRMNRKNTQWQFKLKGILVNAESLFRFPETGGYWLLEYAEILKNLKSTTTTTITN